MYSHSYISIKESAVIKGFLMILIILGHNHLLMDNPDTGAVNPHFLHQRILYLFHVYPFFYLPFIYGHKEVSSLSEYIRNVLKKTCVRLLVPYLIFYVICTSISLYISKIQHVSISYFVIGTITGNQFVIQKGCGFSYLWFLPSFLYIITIRDFYYTYGIIRKFFWMIYILTSTTYILNFWGLENSFYFVSGFGRLILICGNAVICRFLLERIVVYEKYNKGILFVLISLLLILLYISFYVFSHQFFESVNTEFILRLLKIIIQVVFFLFIICKSIVGYLSRFKVLRYIGDNSLWIYLVHIIIYNILVLLIPKEFFIIGRYEIGIIVLILTILLSLLSTRITNKVPLVKNLIMPYSHK